MSTAANPSNRDAASSGVGRDQTTGTNHEPTPTPAEGDRADDPLDGSNDVARSGDGWATDRHSVVDRERKRFGGLKVGSCFFGWLTATGTVVLLASLVSATGVAVGLSQGLDPAAAAQNPESVGLIGPIVLLLVILIGYVCGGYVAARMARFNGVKQGIGVWLWAIVVAVVVAALGFVAGTQFDVLARLGGFPRLPINEGILTTGEVVAAFAVVAVSLIGAVVGGLAGMRYHRRVDKAGLGQ